MVLNEKGWAVPLALMVMVVITLLSTALWFYSMTDLKQVSMEEKKMQAHYLARSGAELVADNYIEQLNEEDFPLTSENQKFADESQAVQYFKVVIDKDEEDNIVITSTGEVDGIRETMKLTINTNGDRHWEKAS